MVFEKKDHQSFLSVTSNIGAYSIGIQYVILNYYILPIVVM
jgi:hypothetical protein